MILLYIYLHLLVALPYLVARYTVMEYLKKKTMKIFERGDNICT